MAVLVGNETYTRFVFDPEEGETKFIISVGGEDKVVSVEELEASLEPEDAKIERMIVVPKPDARKINVTFRPLRSYDKHAVQDITSDTGTVAPGSQRRLLLKRAIVKWDFDVAWSEAILDQLDSGVEEQLWAWVSWGVAPLEQDQESGQPIPLEDEGSKKKTKEKPSEASSSPKTKTDGEQASPEPSVDDSTS